MVTDTANTAVGYKKGPALQSMPSEYAKLATGLVRFEFLRVALEIVTPYLSALIGT